MASRLAPPERKSSKDAKAAAAAARAKAFAGDPTAQESAIAEGETEDMAAEAAAATRYVNEEIPGSEQSHDMDGQIAKISISHDGDYTTAVCIAAEEPMAGDVGGEAQARESH